MVAPPPAHATNRLNAIGGLGRIEVRAGGSVTFLLLVKARPLGADEV